MTLARDRRSACLGMAFEVEPAELERIARELDHREKGGYHRERLVLRLGDGRRVEALTYVAGPSNPHYLGSAPVEALARQIVGAVGPSGPNLDYLERLAWALRELGVDDPHVSRLELACRALNR